MRFPLGPQRPLLALLTLLLLLAPWPTSTAQAPAPDPSTPASAGEVANLTARVAEVSALLQNQTVLLVGMTGVLNAQQGSLQAQHGALQGLNTTLGTRLDALGTSVAIASMQDLNGSAHVQDLAMLVDELVRVQNASFIAQRAEFAATNATLTQASTGLTSGFAGLRHELGQRFDALDRNMTGDHVRLYEGVYVTDPKDPYYKLPAHHAVLVGEKTIAENQVVSHNASQARFESLTSALAASVQAQATLATAMQGHETHAAATAEDVSFLAGKQGWNRGLLYVMIVVILVPMAYLFGPDVVQRIRLQRARIPILPAARDDGLPTEEEMDTLRAEARERGDAEPDSPAASAPSSPRRRLVVSAPEPEAL